MRKQLVKMVIALCAEGIVLLGVITYAAYASGLRIAVPVLQNICQMIG